MSDDKSTTQDLIKTAEDGKDGYAKGAAELKDDHPELAATFTKYSEERSGFSDELQKLAATYGDDVKEKGSVTAAVHRGWLSIRDAVSGSGPESVLKTAIQGDDHAVTAYEKALQEDISPSLKTTVQQQLTKIQAARTDLQHLLETNKN